MKLEASDSILGNFHQMAAEHPFFVEVVLRACVKALRYLQIVEVCDTEVRRDATFTN